MTTTDVKADIALFRGNNETSRLVTNDNNTILEGQKDLYILHCV